MDNQIAQFIDRYSNTDDPAIDSSAEIFEDDVDLTTPWEEFGNTADVWARQGARTSASTMRFLQSLSS